MKTALVIGASRGIGSEFVQQLLADGWKVFATARDDEGLAHLRTVGAEPIKLDVAKTASLAELAWQLDDVKLDLAVYVAGVFGSNAHADTAPTVADFDKVMHTNVRGAMQLIPTVAPMVEAAHGRFIFISSGMGSIGETTSSGGWTYRVSKAALNMAVKAASFDYPKAIMVAMCPGWVRTAMGGANATLSPQESVQGMLRVIDSLKPADTGTYRNHSGKHLPW
ncbi:MAG TPA: SDR family oxidoreductase [Burkholderiaceae bacterium]|jgi:NAD(P)-dependent dehydrogenase (short-subunit alcohol dehydrogenase family)